MMRGLYETNIEDCARMSRHYTFCWWLARKEGRTPDLRGPWLKDLAWDLQKEPQNGKTFATCGIRGRMSVCLLSNVHVIQAII